MTSGRLVEGHTAPPRSAHRYDDLVAGTRNAPIETTSRVQAALDAAVRAVAELAPIDDVLQVIVDQVRPVVDAQYAALGIVDARGRIERFITSGMDAATRRAIGPLPEGHGLLGLIIEENRPFRIPDFNADPIAMAFRRTIRRCRASSASRSSSRADRRPAVPDQQDRRR